MIEASQWQSWLNWVLKDELDFTKQRRERRYSVQGGDSSVAWNSERSANCRWRDVHSFSNVGVGVVGCVYAGAVRNCV